MIPLSYKKTPLGCPLPLARFPVQEIFSAKEDKNGSCMKRKQAAKLN